MDTKQLAEWIDMKICGPCRQGYTCDHFDCSQAKIVADILTHMAPFQGKDVDGKEVSGWFMPERTEH
jgi:hypothetical protein